MYVGTQARGVGTLDVTFFFFSFLSRSLSLFPSLVEGGEGEGSVWVVSWFDPLLTDKKGRSTGAEKKKSCAIEF